MRGTEHSYDTAKHLEPLCFQQPPTATGRNAAQVDTCHYLQWYQQQCLALPYLSLICSRLDTPGSLATSGCRNSSPHTGCSGSPQSLPCTHSGRSPGTAGTASPQDHSHRLQGSQTSVRLQERQKYPKIYRVRGYP